MTARTGDARATARPRSARSWCPRGTPGFTAEKAYDKLGWHASDTHPLTFEDCRVPEANLLGDRGRGYAQFLATLDDGRVAIAALAVGCIQACLDLSRRSTPASGRPSAYRSGASRASPSRSPTSR